jgi:hypothetical protein
MTQALSKKRLMIFQRHQWDGVNSETAFINISTVDSMANGLGTIVADARTDISTIAAHTAMAPSQRPLTG